MNINSEVIEYSVTLEYIGPFLSNFTGTKGQSISFQGNAQEGLKDDENKQEKLSDLWND